MLLSIAIIKAHDFYEDLAGDVENVLTRQIMMKEEEKDLFLLEKNKKVIGMTKDEAIGKIIVKFAATKPKTHGYKVQKDDYEIEDSEFIKAKGIKKTASKELTFYDFDTCVRI